MSSFALQVRRYTNGAQADINKVMINFCRIITYNIVLDTPYGDTSLWQSPPPSGYVPGALRGNWRVGIGQPDLRFNPDEVVDDPIDLISRDLAKINSVPGKIFYLTNSAPYARRIEYTGFSNQAPSGMLRINIAKAKQYLRQAISEANA